MKLSQDTRLAPPDELRNGCGLYMSSKNCYTSSSTKTYKATINNANPNNNKNYSNHSPESVDFKFEVHEMFEKCFLYQKCFSENLWSLPPAMDVFTEYYQLENLQELKIKLNHIKSKLNDYDIQSWSLHTRRQDPASEIPRILKTETNAEFVTIAWCKMYECLVRFPELIQSPQINSLHLCEAPGAFITALNHYLYTNYERKEVQWNWLATTLNPYYEGNHVNTMITDDRFLLYTLDNWLFHKDFTGNIIKAENLEYMKQQCEKRLGDVHLITADGSVDCMETPDCQEERVALLHYAEIIAALMILAKGGSFVIKMFTMFESSTVSKLFLLNCAFEKVHVFKPCTSKRGNSEVYVICLNYKKYTNDLPQIIEKMKMKLSQDNSMLWPLFTKSSLPVSFLRQHEICCRMFMSFQINAIEQNICTYKIKPHKAVIKRLQYLKTAVCDAFYKRNNIQKIPDELKILNKYQEHTEAIYKSQLYIGSYSERKMLETSKETLLFKFRTQLNDLENLLKKNLQPYDLKNEFQTSSAECNIKLSLYRGQSINTLNSSLFANMNLLIWRLKLNNVYQLSCDSLWLAQPRIEFEDVSSVVINFNDFFCSSCNFSVQQENFFKSVVSALLKHKPGKIKFINMPFLTHYAVSALRYLSCLTYLNLSFSFGPKFEIILSSRTSDFKGSLEELNVALFSSVNQDIFCCIQILKLHRNDFSKTLCAFNNMLLLQKYKLLLDT